MSNGIATSGRAISRIDPYKLVKSIDKLAKKDIIYFLRTIIENIKRGVSDITGIELPQPKLNKDQAAIFRTMVSYLESGIFQVSNEEDFLPEANSIELDKLGIYPNMKFAYDSSSARLTLDGEFIGSFENDEELQDFIDKSLKFLMSNAEDVSDKVWAANFLLNRPNVDPKVKKESLYFLLDHYSNSADLDETQKQQAMLDIVRSCIDSVKYVRDSKNKIPFVQFTQQSILIFMKENYSHLIKAELPHIKDIEKADADELADILTLYLKYNLGIANAIREYKSIFPDNQLSEQLGLLYPNSSEAQYIILSLLTTAELSCDLQEKRSILKNDKVSVEERVEVAITLIKSGDDGDKLLGGKFLCGKSLSHDQNANILQDIFKVMKKNEGNQRGINAAIIVIRLSTDINQIKSALAIIKTHSQNIQELTYAAKISNQLGLIDDDKSNIAKQFNSGGELLIKSMHSGIQPSVYSHQSAIEEVNYRKTQYNKFGEILLIFSRFMHPNISTLTLEEHHLAQLKNLAKLLSTQENKVFLEKIVASIHNKPIQLEILKGYVRSILNDPKLKSSIASTIM